MHSSPVVYNSMYCSFVYYKLYVDMHTVLHIVLCAQHALCFSLATGSALLCCLYLIQFAALCIYFYL